jgi:alpha/beta superfamily hydrolase
MAVSIERFFVEEDSLRLEAIFSRPVRPPRGAFVICQPNPLYGGDMYNKVVVKMAEAFLEEDFAALRFNFSGTGRSVGGSPDPLGARHDLAAALGWLEGSHPDLPLRLSGYSYGAFIALSSLLAGVPGAFPDRHAIEGVVAAAYPAGQPEYRLDALPELPVGFVHGLEDELIPASALKKILRIRQRGVEVQWVEGANHFFDGKLPEFQAAVKALIGA